METEKLIGNFVIRMRRAITETLFELLKHSSDTDCQIAGMMITALLHEASLLIVMSSEALPQFEHNLRTGHQLLNDTSRRIFKEQSKTSSELKFEYE